MEAGWNLRGLCPSCCRVPLYLFLISPQLHSLFIWNLHERRFFLRPHFNIVIERSVGRVSVIWFVIYRYVVSAVTFDRSLMLTRSSVSVCDTLSVFYCVFCSYFCVVLFFDEVISFRYAPGMSSVMMLILYRFFNFLFLCLVYIFHYDVSCVKWREWHILLPMTRNMTAF